jgi:hypothetical protein
MRTDAKRVVAVVVSFVLFGCAAEKETVYFDVPSHALGRIIYKASTSKSRREVAQAQEEMVQFQDSYLNYLPDHVSRMIHALNYMLDHNIDPSQFCRISLNTQIQSADPAIPTSTSRLGLARNNEEVGFRKSPEASRSPVFPEAKPNGLTLNPVVRNPQVDQAQKASPPPLAATFAGNASNPLETLSNHFVSKLSTYSKSGSGNVTIAVHPFRITDLSNPQAQRETSSVLESEIERALIGKQNIKIVTRRNLKDIQAERRLSESDLNSSSDTTPKYNLLEADLIVRGQATISNGKKDMALICELVDPASGVVWASKQLLIQPRGGSVEYFVKK